MLLSLMLLRLMVLALSQQQGLLLIEPGPWTPSLLQMQMLAPGLPWVDASLAWTAGLQDEMQRRVWELGCQGCQS